MGVFEEAKGKIKQAAGDVTDNEQLQAEGSAQSDRGAEEREATEARTKAQAHEKAAETADQKQQAADNA